MNPPTRYPKGDTVILKTVMGIMTAQGFSMMLQMSASVVAARLVAPEAIGYVAWIGIWPLYAVWLTWGVVLGAERAIPIRRGEDRQDEIKSIYRTAFSVTSLAMIACVLAGVAAWLIIFPFSMPALQWKCLAAGVLSAATIFNNFVVMNLVVSKRFRLMGAKFLTEGFLWWGFLPLVAFDVMGLTIRMLAVSIISPVIFLFVARIECRPRFSRSLARDLARVGLALLAVRFLLSLSYGLDRTMLAFLMDDRALGYYMIAIMVVTLMKLVPYALGRVLYPNLGEMYGKEKNISLVARAALKPMPVMICMMLPAIVAGWFLAEPLTRILLPQYLPGVPAARIVLVGSLFAPLLSGHVFYNVIKKQFVFMRMLIGGLLTQVAVTLSLFFRFGTLVCFSWGLLAGLAVSAILLISGMLFYMKRHDQISAVS